MKRRNRQVYVELEKRSALLNEVVQYVEPLIARVEELEGENRRLRLALALTRNKLFQALEPLSDELLFPYPEAEAPTA